MEAQARRARLAIGLGLALFWAALAYALSGQAVAALGLGLAAWLVCRQALAFCAARRAEDEP